ncbi:MAG: NUDIX hydrolase [Candidatus Binatia bacterium]
MPAPVVAAICYRRKNGKIEFLLVRAKSGDYWSFPKGHVEKEPSELPWQAAQREAGEEAGVGGAIDTEPFTSYAYGKNNAREDDVAAYLMSVESERKPDEPEREPQWFSPERAIERLAAGDREERYAREDERVIREALARLERQAA